MTTLKAQTSTSPQHNKKTKATHIIQEKKACLKNPRDECVHHTAQDHAVTEQLS